MIPRGDSPVPPLSNGELLLVLHKFKIPWTPDPFPERNADQLVIYDA